MATGVMVDGQWQRDGYRTDEAGRFLRDAMTFRSRIAEGTRHRPEAGRYHLYVSYACPWAHRVLILRALLGLEDALGVSVVSPLMLDEGWEFSPFPGVVPDTCAGVHRLRELYALADPHFTGRVTVPVLFDKETRTILNNESREILRMLDRTFQGLARTPRDLCPAELEAAIDRTIDLNYQPINNGVYRAGFARSQAAYEEAVSELFAGLDRCEETLARGGPWLLGDVLTEADICLFTTLVRFDAVYYVHFKCARQHVWDYPNLWQFTRRFYALPGVRETVHFDHILNHYYRSHPHVNPSGIVPSGPDMARLLTEG